MVVTIIFLYLFIIAFEFSCGPVVWLYNAEIIDDKALGISTLVTFLMKLITSISVPLVAAWLGQARLGYIFVFTGIITGISVIFIYCFLKETFGKS